MRMWIRIPIEEITSASSGTRRRIATGAHTTSTVAMARTLGSRKPSVMTPSSSRMSWLNTDAIPTTMKIRASTPSTTNGLNDRRRSSWRSIQFTVRPYRIRPAGESAQRTTRAYLSRRTSSRSIVNRLRADDFAAGEADGGDITHLPDQEFHPMTTTTTSQFRRTSTSTDIAVGAAARRRPATGRPRRRRRQGLRPGRERGPRPRRRVRRVRRPVASRRSWARRARASRR